MAERDNTAALGAAFEPDYESRPTFDQRLTRMVGRMVKRRAQAILRWGLGAIGAALRDWQEPLPPLRAGDPRIRRILVVRVDLLGDVVLSTPAVRALRRAYPRAKIDMLVQAPFDGILAGEPDINRILVWNPHVWRNPRDWLRPGSWRAALATLGRMRLPRYDLAVSISGDIGSIVTRLSGARRRVGYAGEAYGSFMTDPVPGARYLTHQHETRYVLGLAAAAGGIVQPGDEIPRLSAAPEPRARMRAALAEARERLGTTGPTIALHAGARNGQAKRWPARHWAALARMLGDELGALVVLTGAPNEAPLAGDVERMAGRPLLNLCGQTSLSDLKALLAECDLVISGDSGPMHIACALGRPVIVLHGPTDPAISGPTTPDAIVLRLGLWCSPCYDASATAECPFGNPTCMKDMAPGAVFAVARRRLAELGLIQLDTPAPSKPLIPLISLAAQPIPQHVEQERPAYERND
ncbi:MAG TPA: lipopolysaccharide heptosyltransferase II [Ktedonobacterales bacterium]|nr:lipopolysaccharide heptosyltransferase II [Ktedonobacterales bacterium]